MLSDIKNKEHISPDCKHKHMLKNGAPPDHFKHYHPLVYWYFLIFFLRTVFVHLKVELILYCYSLYRSPAYLEEHLAIFHASFIQDCLMAGDVNNVALGAYFLPPPNLNHGNHILISLTLSSPQAAGDCFIMT